MVNKTDLDALEDAANGVFAVSSDNKHRKAKLLECGHTTAQHRVKREFSRFKKKKPRTRHTLKDRHGHCYTWDTSCPLSDFKRECISAKQASEMDLMTEKLEGRWRISRRYHTCWTCWNPTENVGGYGAADHSKILFYECEKCDDDIHPKRKKKK